VASPARSAANEKKLGSPWHYLFRGSLLRVWLWWHRIGSTPISHMQHVWALIRALVRSWIGFSAADAYTWSSYSVHFLSWRFTSSSVFSAAYMACLRLGRVEWTKPSVVQQRSKPRASSAGQSQVVLLSMAEDDECYTCFSLSYLVVKLIALLGHLLVFFVFWCFFCTDTIVNGAKLHSF
jgi:hypothetical protein